MPNYNDHWGQTRNALGQMGYGSNQVSQPQGAPFDVALPKPPGQAPSQPPQATPVPAPQKQQFHANQMTPYDPSQGMPASYTPPQAPNGGTYNYNQQGYAKALAGMNPNGMDMSTPEFFNTLDDKNKAGYSAYGMGKVFGDNAHLGEWWNGPRLDKVDHNAKRMAALKKRQYMQWLRQNDYAKFQEIRGKEVQDIMNTPGWKPNGPGGPGNWEL